MRQVLHRSLLAIERALTTSRSQRKVPLEKTFIENYDGYANEKHAIIRGRVMKEPKAWEFRKSDSGWRNFRGVVRYWLTTEVQNASIKGEIDGVEFETSSDEEGYFRVKVDLPKPITTTGRFVRFTTKLKNFDRTFEGQVQVLQEKTERIIISDIDDTVMETGARQLWQMVKTTLLKNVHTRSVFPGVANFYRSLLDDDQNLLFYVTSSPWNLRAFLQQIFELRNVPRGPAFMTDWGLDEEKMLKHGHGKHKLNAIRAVLNFYPELPCILIGDSGEKDPEIYAQIVEEFPERVDAIYIRDVTDHARDQTVLDLGASCARNGVPFLLVSSTDKAAQHAREHKFVHMTGAIASNPLDEEATWTQPVFIEQATL